MAKYALLIGVGNYQNQDVIQPSLTARNDVEAIREVLLRPDIGGFAEVPKPLLDPDRMQMEEEIENFSRKLGRDDLAVLLFAGQGVRDRQGNAFLTTASTRRNVDGELVRATALSAHAVQDIMSGSRAEQQVMILDCGFGGMEPHAKPTYNGSLNLKHQLGGQGRVILLGAEAAHHIPQFDSDELSPYAHLLVEGICTGKADRNHDRLVSVDELHAYILDELKAVLAEGHPELIAWREEDCSIPLTRVPVFDPRQQYRAQVEQRVQDGQISPIGRAILDKRRMTLGLRPSDAQAIEDEILHPYREREKDLQRYRQALQAAVRQAYPLPESVRQELQEFQHLLELSNDEVEPIQQEVMQPYAERAATQRQHHQQYEQVFRDTIAQHFPPTPGDRYKLQQVQRSLDLPDDEVHAIETRISTVEQAQREQYHQTLHQFEQAWQTEMRATYPPTDIVHHRMQKLQHSLGIKEAHAREVFQRVRSQIEAEQAAHQANCAQYETAFLEAVKQDGTLRKPTRDRLAKLQQALNLSDADVVAAEDRVSETLCQESYQRNLAYYRQTCEQLLQKEFPLSAANQDELKRLQTELQLQDDDVAQIHEQLMAQATEQRRAYQRALQQYEITYRETLTRHNPIDDVTRHSLDETWQALKLDADEVRQLEERLNGGHSPQTSDKPSESAEPPAEPEDSVPLPSATNSPVPPPPPSLAKGRSEQPDSDSGIPPFEQLSAGKQAKIDAEVKALHDLLERGDVDAVVQQLTNADSLEDASSELPTDTSVPPSPPNLTEAQPDEPKASSAPPFEQLSSDNQAKIDAEVEALHDLLERGDVDAVMQKLTAPESPEDSSAEAFPPKPSETPTNNNGGVSAPDRPLPEEPPSAPPPPPSPAAPPEPVNPSPAPSSNDHGEGAFVPGYVPPPPHTSTPNDDLASDRNIEYTALQGLLQDGMWREADHETLRVMLLATNRTKDEWLSPEALAEFPCLDLQTISNLWEKYSNGHFGFIAQERIYAQFRDLKMSNDRRLIDVTLRLKWMWRAANFYPMFRQYKDLDFKLDTAVTGHLPAMWFWKLSPLAAFRTGTLGNSRSFGGTDIKMLANLMRRLRECNIQ
ncbi:MAG: GUN4 domain-containing protein [Cyanobacteria bacterium J06638_20]